MVKEKIRKYQKLPKYKQFILSFEDRIIINTGLGFLVQMIEKQDPAFYKYL